MSIIYRLKSCRISKEKEEERGRGGKEMMII